MKQEEYVTPNFGPLVAVCKRFGISRSMAFRMAAEGLLDTFKMNTRRYVLVDSVRSLPDRLSREAKVRI